MHDFIGQIKKIKNTNSESYKEIEALDCASDTPEENIVVFRCPANLLLPLSLVEGAWVKIRFAVEGRLWEGRRFNNLVCRRIRVLAEPKNVQCAESEKKEENPDEVPF